MAITTEISPDSSCITIKVTGRFDFQCHEMMRRAYEPHLKTPARFVVDLSQTDYLDSSALGMLMLLRKYAGTDKGRVGIYGAKESVRRVLDVANFGKLFVMG